MDAYKQEMKSMRAELDQQHTDRPYYAGGSRGMDAEDKVDDDALHRQQRGRDWTSVDDPSKVSLLGTMVVMLQVFCIATVVSFISFLCMLIWLLASRGFCCLHVETLFVSCSCVAW